MGELMDIQELEASLTRSTWSKGELRKLLRYFGACKPGLQYVVGQNLCSAWNHCTDDRFMSWWVRKVSDARNDEAALERLRVVEKTLKPFFPRTRKGLDLYKRRTALALRENFNYYGKIKR